jgi:uncharacterized protein (TIGR02118 family)
MAEETKGEKPALEPEAEAKNVARKDPGVATTLIEENALMVKLIICAKRKTGMTRKEFDAYWQNQHGPLVKSVPEFMRHVRKYVQCHIVENSVPLGVAASYDGVAELWFDSVEEIAQAFNEPRYLEIIRRDEHKFAELADCISFVTQEVPIA